MQVFTLILLFLPFITVKYCRYVIFYTLKYQKEHSSNILSASKAMNSPLVGFS